MEVVFASKHRPWHQAVPGVPQGNAISMEIFLPCAMDFEVYMHLPVLEEARQVVPDRTLFAALVRGQTHILAREHCASLEVPEERGAGTDPVVGLDKRMLPLEMFTVAVSYIRSHRPQQQEEKQKYSGAWAGAAKPRPPWAPPAPAPAPNPACCRRRRRHSV